MRTKPEVCENQYLKALCLTFTLMYLLRIWAFVLLVKSKFFTTPKSPTCRLRQSNSSFEKSKKFWIALKFQNKSPIEIHWAYIIASYKTNIPFHAWVNSDASSIISRAWAESQANHFRADTRKSDPFHIFWSQNQTVWATEVGLGSFCRFF